MSLIEKLYSAVDEDSLQEIWRRFPFAFFDPSLRYLGFKAVRKAVENKDRGFFVNQVRNNFLPEDDDEIVQEKFRHAINRGVNGLNLLCQEHLGEEANHFLINEISPPLDFLEFTRKAKEDWVTARSGKHKIGEHILERKDYELLFRAYDKIRAWGLGYWVLMIDSAPEVLNSLRHYNTILKWLEDHFRFRNPQPIEITDKTDLTHVWQTNAGIEIYGSATKPISSRLKILTEDEKLKYGSILMKLFLKQTFMEQVRDYTGIEFIVRDNEARDRLITYFDTNIRVVGTLEAFKDSRRGIERRSKHSDLRFDCTKFVFRPPIPVSRVEPYESEGICYERVPVEIQILTLEGDKQRRENPDIEHKKYKEKQFREVFPLWYPRAIYEPLIT